MELERGRKIGLREERFSYRTVAARMQHLALTCGTMVVALILDAMPLNFQSALANIIVNGHPDI